MYQIIDGVDFNLTGKSKKSKDLLRMRESPNSEDWVTWTAFRLLMKYEPTTWWARFIDCAKADNPALALPANSGIIPAFMPWTTVNSPEAYLAASRNRMQLSDNIDWQNRCANPRAVEGKSEVDVRLENVALMLFAEAKLLSDVSTGTTYDPDRNQIARNVDCLLGVCGSKVPIFWMLVRDKGQSRQYVQLIDQYRSNPTALAQLIPHRNPADVAAIAGNISLVTWRDLLAPIFNRPGQLGPDAVTIAELDRRV